MIRKIEQVVDLTGSKDFLQLFRVDFKGMRLYVKEDPFMYFSGLTGALSSSTFAGNPEHKRLMSWREGMIQSFGKEETYNYVDATAEFGTLLHEALVTLDRDGKIVWSEERDKADGRFRDWYMLNGKTVNERVLSSMVYEYQKHVGSLMQFVYDRVEKIYAIEVPAIWDNYKIATPIDIVCSCRPTPKGKFVDTTINIKTSSQISEHQMVQASCELEMWNKTYPRLKCSNTAILRTKNWREGKLPTYDFKYLSEEDASQKSFIKSKQLALCLESDASYYPEPTYKSFTGETVLGEMPDVRVIGIQEEWERIRAEKDQILNTKNK